MEQESPKLESEETEFQTLNGPILCANNCGFFGSSATDNLCSRCYEDQFRTKLKALLSIDALDFPQIEDKDKSKASGVDGRVVESKPVREQAAASASSAEAPCPNKPKNRCCFCNKKLGLLGFKCRCGDVFCSVHRYVDEHNCGFDYRGAGQAAISKANPVVKADKIDKI